VRYPECGSSGERCNDQQACQLRFSVTAMLEHYRRP
jgi:hypothetical protein